VAIITNSGGTGVELADLLAEEGLEVPELSAALQRELRACLPAFASPRNPVDMTPVWTRFAELYPMLVERLARSGEVDAVVPVLLQRSALDERVAMGVRDAVARLRNDVVPVPVYVCWVAPRAARPNADLLAEAGIPCFDWPERTARALGHAARYGRARLEVRPAGPAPPRPTGLPPLAPGLLDAGAGAALLGAFDIPTVESVICETADGAAAAAVGLGFPVVAKALHPELVHKSDRGGVRVGLSGHGEVLAAASDLLALAPGGRVLVQRQAGGIEVVVGGIRDPQFGPAVMVGLGGVLVEVLGDVAFALAPLRADEARRLVERLQGFAALTGARGREAVDLDALARVVCAVGDLLVAVPEVAELDLNPVLGRAAGCVAVDWRIVVALAGSGAGPDSPCGGGEGTPSSP
jgi:acetyltransferase